MSPTEQQKSIARYGGKVREVMGSGGKKIDYTYIPNILI